MEPSEEQELILDLLIQGCGVIERKGQRLIDNQCTSVYEWACEYLERQGLLERVAPRFSRIKEAADGAS